MKITELPYDVLEGIRSYLDNDSVRELCSTCKGFMDWLQDDVYHTFDLDQTAPRGRSLLALQSGPRAKCLRFIRYMPDEVRPANDSWNDEDIDVSLSAESCEGLRSLAKFPNLETFHFWVEWELDNWDAGPFYFLEGTVDEDEAWFKLINESFEALSESGVTLTRLKIDRLPPVCYPAHNTAAWHSILTSLKSLDIQFPEIEDIDGEGGLNRCETLYIQSLGRDFLNHLPNVEYLRLAAGPEGLIGFPCEYKAMPRLKTLEIEWASLFSVPSFINSHSATLEEIHLKNCFAHSRQGWWDLFNEVRTNVSQLVEFEATQAHPTRHVAGLDHTDHPQFYAAHITHKYGDIRDRDQAISSDSRSDDGAFDEGTDDTELLEVLEELSKLEAFVEENVAKLRSKDCL